MAAVFHVNEGLEGRRVRELDTGRKGTVTAAAPGDPRKASEPELSDLTCARAYCAVAFDDGTTAEGLRLGPYGQGDVVLADEAADPGLYDTSEAGIRRYRALAGLRMYEGLAATLAGHPGRPPEGD